MCQIAQFLFELVCVCAMNHIIVMSSPPVNTALQPPSSITKGATTNTTVSVSWSLGSGATGYYLSYQRQDLGAPPVVTPQYERIVGGATNVTLSDLQPGTTYTIRVWSTDGTSVSSEAREMNMTTMESGECFVHASVGYCFREASCCLLSHSAFPSLCTAAMYHIW